ncbi:MAG: uncharacterized protein AEth_01420 [Candidatus Argoarchaeum ethanivorans]|uniref:CAAX prenyl protease 2/Lysostaphin resistance protein A-like domain-containing protein n=1 Tax=Candidatus Argoarchaeum ethanivorans TaxID=2608793 RepID=A0A8B3S1X7_9EURY|nr:MAG: uncharacterized protein AEth_01420 [Candidatus Argoarchaeum ethanivorans]
MAVDKMRSWFQPANNQPFSYIILVALAELLIAHYHTGMGLALHIITLFALFTHAAFLHHKEKERAQLLTVMAMAPLIRIASLYTPLSSFHFIHWFLILSIPLFSCAFTIILVQHLHAQDIGLVFNFRKLHIQLAIASTGILFGIIEYFILHPHPLVIDLSFRSLAAPILIMFVCTGFLEEMIFRGIIQHNAVKYFNDNIGIFFTATLFAVMHIGNLSLIDVVFVFFVGYFYGYAVKFTRSIIGVSISHGLTNIILFLIMPLVWTV